eukprot:g2090.t1
MVLRLTCVWTLRLWTLLQLPLASSDLLLSKYYLNGNADCTGDWDLVKVEKAEDECIPSTCTADVQFGGTHQAECVSGFDVDLSHVTQEFHALGSNCSKEPLFVLVHHTNACRNILGEFMRFQCDGAVASVTRFASSEDCVSRRCGHGCRQSNTECDTNGRNGWHTQIKGCAYVTYTPSDMSEAGVSVADSGPPLGTLLSGQLWEAEGGWYAGSASSLSAMSASVQIILGIVSFILTLAALT